MQFVKINKKTKKQKKGGEVHEDKNKNKKSGDVHGEKRKRQGGEDPL